MQWKDILISKGESEDNTLPKTGPFSKKQQNSYPVGPPTKLFPGFLTSSAYKATYSNETVFDVLDKNKQRCLPVLHSRVNN
jgi:hypothetical protein